MYFFHLMSKRQRTSERILAKVEPANTFEVTSNDASPSKKSKIMKKFWHQQRAEKAIASLLKKSRGVIKRVRRNEEGKCSFGG